jgi:hypothetical protein
MKLMNKYEKRSHLSFFNRKNDPLPEIPHGIELQNEANRSQERIELKP